MPFKGTQELPETSVEKQCSDPVSNLSQFLSLLTNVWQWTPRVKFASPAILWFFLLKFMLEEKSVIVKVGETLLKMLGWDLQSTRITIFSFCRVFIKSTCHRLSCRVLNKVNPNPGYQGSTIPWNLKIADFLEGFAFWGNFTIKKFTRKNPLYSQQVAPKYFTLFLMIQSN